MTTTQVSAFTTGDIQAMTTAETAALTSAQAAALSSAQIQAMTTTNVAVLGTAEVHALSTTAFHAMSSTQIQNLTTAEVQALTTAHIASLTTDQLSGFSTGDIAALTTAQVAAFTTAHIAALTTDQITHLSTADISAFSTAQAAALTTTQIVAFTTDQIAGFTTHDLAAMSSTQAQSFTSSEIGVMTNAQVDALVSASPLVLDLSGTGITTTSAAQGVSFDLTGSGHASTMGWTTANEGLLALDLNGNGQIDNGTELFGVGTKLADGTRAGNGYAALAQYDTNHDGKIDASDAIFSKLVVWVDANHDGKSEPGELYTMAQLGITSISLNDQVSGAASNGNIIGLTSSYTTSDGAQHEMADVWFTKATTPATTLTTASTPSLSDLLAPPATTLLPGHATDAATTTTAHVATSTPEVHASALHGLMSSHLLDDEQNRANPLI
jgi:hypothetical protein